MEKAPFDWPAPRALINERCEEGGGGWPRKSLGCGGSIIVALMRFAYPGYGTPSTNEGG